MSGKLSTHVLDTYHGKPAHGICWALMHKKPSNEWASVINGTTNSDGRTDGLLLDGETLKTGTYQLHFQAGDYYKKLGLELPEPAFLDRIIIEFSLQAGGSYHVPLLLTPWSYSTYRGS